MALHQRSNSLMFCIVVLFGSFFSPRPGSAQANLATVRGQVTGQQGATVPDALVTARDTATNLTRTSTTQSNGQYLLSNAPRGSLFAEVFNLANTDNFTTYQGSIQSSAFKTPQAENPKRRAQFGFRFDL